MKTAPVAEAEGPRASCDRCRACCCRLEVMLMPEDDVDPAFTTQDRWGGWVMKRLADGWCAALDRETFRCTIYDERPSNCRVFEMGGDHCLAVRADQGVDDRHG